MKHTSIPYVLFFLLVSVAIAIYTGYVSTQNTRFVQHVPSIYETFSLQ